MVAYDWIFQGKTCSRGMLRCMTHLWLWKDWKRARWGVGMATCLRLGFGGARRHISGDEDSGNISDDPMVFQFSEFWRDIWHISGDEDSGNISDDPVVFQFSGFWRDIWHISGDEDSGNISDDPIVFPMVFQWFSNGFPMAFQWFSNGYPKIISRWSQADHLTGSFTPDLCCSNGGWSVCDSDPAPWRWPEMTMECPKFLPFFGLI